MAGKQAIGLAVLRMAELRRAAARVADWRSIVVVFGLVVCVCAYVCVGEEGDG